MKEEIRDFLIENSEEKYREFSKALIPGEETMLGVRLPVLRKKAKELAKGNWREELETEDIYFEEIMLRGMMLSYVKESLSVMLPYIEAYIPCVKNWSVCDSVFSKMDVLRRDRDKTWEFIQPYLYSDEEFEIRTAVIIMMQHVLKCDEEGKNIKRLTSISLEDCLAGKDRPDEGNTGSSAVTDKESGQRKRKKEEYLPQILEALNREFPAYYASMAAAWTIAEAFCCYPAPVYEFLQDNRLDDDTYNRALQKIVESLIPCPEVKAEIRKMKRKK
ncbi:MAG: DNA alkylation repair protein [Lachnospiraceae bacterium]|nr:DNA alkylation repair protein [Lachnospiraceae bacterium]